MLYKEVDFQTSGIKTSILHQLPGWCNSFSGPIKKYSGNARFRRGCSW